MIRTIIFTIMFFALVSVATAADDNKNFGNCLVQTTSDDFTDAKSINLACQGKGDSLGSYYVLITCRPKSVKFVLLVAGLQMNLDKNVDVIYRFDKGQVGKGSWIWVSKSSGAINTESTIFDEFRKSLGTSKQLIFKVGDNKGVVNLNGGDKASKEYERRCKLHVK